MIPKYIYIYIFVNLFFIFISLKNNFSLNIGPNSNLNLYGFIINSWKKWFLFMILFIMKNVIIDYYGKLYNNWYHYEIEEKYTKKIKIWNYDSMIELIFINIVDFVDWLYNLLEYLIFLETEQLQLFIPNFISKYLISNNYFHYNMMKNKF